MERHRCKLCLRSFSNGRALGGHVRSHMLNLPIPRKFEEEQEQKQEDDIHIQLSPEVESASSSSSDEEEQGDRNGDRDGDGEEKVILYELRENPNRSIKSVDPEIASVVVQDRESETETSKNPTRRRSKRTRRPLEHQFQDTKTLRFNGFCKTAEYSREPNSDQPVSSVSDTTTEEDVAFCLMMLSRDNKWKHKNKQKQDKRYEQDLEEEEETEESDEESKACKIRSRGKYKCETCNRVFKSYQALGGHRASHKKLKLYNPTTENAVTSCSVPTKKIHECPYCFRVFSSGQALGGHKRSHVIGAAASHSVRISTKIGDNLNLLDLNLPAPIDEDDASQIELSVVSDA